MKPYTEQGVVNKNIISKSEKTECQPIIATIPRIDQSQL